jgi:hypothetical protein
MSGYIYCLSNPETPDILIIGGTEGTMYMLLNNTNYVCEIAKEVANPMEKETQLHKLLAEYKVSESTHLFNISLDKVKLHFESIDGKIWISRAREFYLKFTSEYSKINPDFTAKSSSIECDNIKTLPKHTENAALDGFLDHYIFGLAKGAASQNMAIIDYMKKIVLAMEGKLDSTEALNIMATHIVSQNS